MLLTECSTQGAQPCEVADARFTEIRPAKVVAARQRGVMVPLSRTLVWA